MRLFTLRNSFYKIFQLYQVILCLNKTNTHTISIIQCNLNDKRIMLIETHTLTSNILIVLRVCKIYLIVK